MKEAQEEMIRVLLVDDHILVRRGVAELLAKKEGIEIVGEAANGAEALEKVRVLMPDVVLMDVYMPGCNGLEATRRIKEEFPYVKVIMLTVADQDRVLFEAIKAGAQGYLLKEIEPEELIQMIKGVQRGEAPISRTTAARLLAEYSREAKEGPKKPRTESPLTEREQQVLELVAKGQTNKEIAAALHISNSTVKNHLSNILEKLHLQNRIQAATYATREGLIGKS